MFSKFLVKKYEDKVEVLMSILVILIWRLKFNIQSFWFSYIVNLLSHFFATSRRKVLDPNGPYISTSQT